MAAHSTMLDLGTEAPSFALPEPATGRVVSLDDLAGSPVLVVVFLSNHCPYVKHLQHRLATVAGELAAEGAAFVGINANDVAAYPDDAPERMVEEVARVGYPFPYLFDASQEVAAAYRAACTPDFFVFDGGRRLAYRGRFDETRPGQGTPTGRDLAAAVRAVLAGEPVPEPQRASIGCSIKWKPGNEPVWAGAS